MEAVLEKLSHTTSNKLYSYIILSLSLLKNLIALNKLVNFINLLLQFLYINNLIII